MKNNNAIKITSIIISFIFLISLTNALDFGGMYYKSILTDYCTRTNPATTECSCPTGYTPKQTWGFNTPDNHYPDDNKVFYCYREHQEGRNGFYDFGGMWGGPSYKNPATNAFSCPEYYTAQQLTGITNIDYSTYYCYKPYTGTSGFDFGGMFADYWSARSNPYFHPKTGNLSCPEEYTKFKILGTNNVDWNLYFCYKNLTNQGNGNQTNQTNVSYVNSISGLNHIVSNSWIYWTWNNPQLNFAKAIIYLDGVNVANTTNSFFNATNLVSNTTHTIRINTLGANGVINTTNVADSATTLPINVIIYNLPGITNVSSFISFNWIYLNWTNPSQLLTNTLFLNGVNVANTTSNQYNFTGLLPNTNYLIRIHSLSTNSSINFNDFSINLKTLINGNQTNQTNVSYVNSISGLNHIVSNSWIYWTWNNPQLNFAKAIIYLDGVNVANTTNSFFNATGFSPSTTHTILVYTKSNSGYINQTGVSDSATTLSETVIPHTHSSSGSRGPVIIDSHPQIETTDRTILTPSQNYINLTSSGFNENKKSVNGLLILWISLGVLIFVLIVLIIVLLLK